MEAIKIKSYLDKGVSLTEQGFSGLDHQMVLVWDELDKNEAIIRMENENKNKMGGMR